MRNVAIGETPRFVAFSLTSSETRFRVGYVVVFRFAAVEACELLFASLRTSGTTYSLRTVHSQLLVSGLSHLEYITQRLQTVWSHTSRDRGLVVGMRRLGKYGSRGLRT